MPDVSNVSELLARLSREEHEFAEFFQSPSRSLSLTIARWPAGSVDTQQPHTEDEVYYVIGGRASLVIAGSATSVGAGSVAFVAAGLEHRFVDIDEDLDVLVFWSPARHTNEPASG